MADLGTNGPLIASLLMGQRQEENPFQAQRKYGRDLIVKASTTQPLGSGNWLEGLARALQGGIGGYMAGSSIRDEEDQNKFNTGLYSDAAKIAQTNPQGALDILKGLKGGGYENQALLGQILQSSITTGIANQQAKAAIDAGGYGGAGGTGTPPTQGNGLGITITPGQQPGGAAPTGTGANNVGNISDGRGGFRQYDTPQAGAADLTNLLRSYPVQYNNGNPMTIRQIARIYAPADDGKTPQLRGNNPDQWALNVANRSGIHPDTPLNLDDPAIVTRVVSGINPAEKAPGQVQPAGVLQQGVAQGMDPQAQPPQGQPPAQGPQGGPQVAQAGQSPMQVPAPTVSSQGNILRAQADKLSSAGQHALALPLYKQAVEADAKFADDITKESQPGTSRGDIAILQAAIRNPEIAKTAEYAAAHARQGKPQMAQGGQLYFPDMSAYPQPVGGGAQQGRFQDTPESQFKIAQDFSKQYGEDQAVKNWRTIEPVITSMREAVAHPSKAADLQLATGLATLYAPQGGGGLPRGEMLKRMLEVESIPSEIRTAIRGAISGQGMDPEARARIMAEAETRASAHKQQFDAVTQQYTQRGAKYGIKPEDFMTGPASSQAPAEGTSKIRSFNPTTGKLE